MVEVTPRTGVQRDHLIGEVQRGVLRLLEQFDHPLAAVELVLRGLIEFGAHLGEGFEFTEGGEVEPERTGDLLHGLRLGIPTHARDRDPHVDRGTHPGEEQARLQVDLAVGDRNHVRRDVCGDFPFQRFNDRQGRHRPAAEFITQLRSPLQQTAVAVEHVPGIGFATGWTPHQQRQLTVGDGLLRQIVVHDQSVLPLVHEVFGNGGPGVRSDVLQRSGVRRGRGHDDRVVHRPGSSQRFGHRSHVGGTLSARDVDADDIPALLIDDRIDRDSCLAGLAVADDQFALTATDGGHGVDGLDPGLERLLHGLATSDAGRGEFDRAGLAGDDRSLAVERVAQRADDATDEGLTDRHGEQGSGGLDLVTFLNLQVVPEDNDPDGGLFQVEAQPPDAAFELDHFARHRVRQAHHARNPVADLDHTTDFSCLDLSAKVFNFLLEN